MLPNASPLTSAAAVRWSALAVPRWVTKGALTVGWVVAFVAALLGDYPVCTAQDPAICGPEQWFGWWSALCLATPILLIWMPLTGCVAGLIFALADVTYDHVTSARIAFGLHGLACAVTAGWLLRAAVAQERVAAEATGGTRASVPSADPPSADPPPAPRLRLPALVLAAAFAVLGGSLIGWYVHETRAERTHLSAAEQVTGRVTAVDSDSFTITMAATARAGTRPVTTGVLDLQPYPLGRSVQVLVDPEDLSWSRLVAEPQDATGWQSLGLLGLLLAVLLAGREMYARRELRGLLTGQHPALKVWVIPDASGVLVLPDDGTLPDVTQVRAVARVPLSWEQSAQIHGEDDDSWDQEEWDEDTDGPMGPDAEKAAFGRLWRGEEEPEQSESVRFGPVIAEPAVLLGSLRDGGRALLVTEKGTLVPPAPLRVGNLPARGSQSLWNRLLARVSWFDRARGTQGDTAVDRAEHGAQDHGDHAREDSWLPGLPIQATGTPGSRLDLPVTALSPRRVRILGQVTMAAGLVGAPAAVLLLDQSWYERGGTIVIGFSVLLGGVARARQHIRLTANNLEIVGALRIHHVPWERLHGVRLDGVRLHVAWEPDLIAEVGPFEPDPAEADQAGQAARAERLGAAMLRLREDALRNGAPVRPPRSRLGPAWGLAAAYLVLVCLALWAVAA